MGIETTSPSIKQYRQKLMNSKLSIYFVQHNGIITVSASFPTVQVKNFAWGIIGSVAIWLGLPILPAQAPSLPPANPPVEKSQPIVNK
jgi:hypothetical protein